MWNLFLDFVGFSSVLKLGPDRWSETGTKYTVIMDKLNCLGFEEVDVDLGWGEAVYAGPTEVASFIGSCVKYRKRDGENGIMVPICLPLSTVERFQEVIMKVTQGNM
ncbi:hypothetical protein Patl1_29405 [Pistacia atlantica]|uniref:Uncharacterized protein n=1 Tax=Pistacia atlantica TaxID=434234 RepID=A0ACC1AEG0_9ROSI|nr:hypothetical protein Patl1_29405 [Pistacia atlantica]